MINVSTTDLNLDDLHTETLDLGTSDITTESVQMDSDMSFLLSGIKGDKGDPLTWDDLTDEQKAELKGEKGDPLTWNDLTPEQKASLKGEKGDPLTWWDLTQAQKLSLRGDKGDPGKTPVKGIDYWTPVDITQLETEIKNDLAFPTVVQETGDSTKDVMSQLAVTNAISTTVGNINALLATI